MILEMCSALAAEHLDPEAVGPVLVDGHSLTLAAVDAVARGAPVALPSDPSIRRAVDASRKLKLELIARGVPLYGITTGFGDSVHRQISPSKADRLQLHLIRGLGAGTGQITPEAAARAIVLVRANSLVRGHSGVRIELIQTLLDLLNAGITPVIPEEGSVGASGDLVPLSYVASVLTGTRDVIYNGRVMPAADAMRDAHIEPLTLETKEGLGLVNGTAFMTGIGSLVAVDARRLAVL